MKALGHAGLLLILSLPFVVAVPAGGQLVAATRLHSPPRIDGRIDFGEWREASRLEFDRGFVAVGNDRTRLYLLIDVLDDDAADARSPAGEGDWIEVVLDIDGDGAVTPDVDRVYTLLPGTYDWRIQEFAATDGSRHLPDPARTVSSVAAGFGCFSADGTQVLYLPPLAPTCARHRVWEVAIDLEEIGRHPSSFIPSLTDLRLGVLVHSETPAFLEEIPSGFALAFDRMLVVELAPVPAVIADPSAEIHFDQEVADGNGDGIVDDPVEITQATQTRGNTLRLVARKDTAARVYVEVQEDRLPQLVTVWLHGTRDGHDLPGSPLSAELWAQPDAEFPVRVLFGADADGGSGVRFGRDHLGHTANFLLPEDWTRADGVTFEAQARFRDQVILSRPVEVFFRRRATPVHVTIPINEGSAAAPVSVGAEELAAAESFLETMYPVPGIDFRRMELPPLNLAAPIGEDGALLQEILDQLLGFYDLLAAEGTEPPPDQLYGYTATSHYAKAATIRAGLCETPGCGHVAAGNVYGEDANLRRQHGYATMAHEINHNIGDPDSWGGHVPGGGVDPSTVDPEWLRLWEESEGGVEDGYADNVLREFGFDTRLPWANGYDRLAEPFSRRVFTVVPPYFKEIMGISESFVDPPGAEFAVQVHPVKWTSPYRWERMFDAFAPPPPPGPGGPRRAAAHVSAELRANGTGALRPVYVLPLESHIPAWDPAGTHTLSVSYQASRFPLQIRFTPPFVDEDGNPLDVSPLRLVLPLRSGITRIALRRGEKVLDEIVVSRHQPLLRVTAPAGKAAWNGRQVVQWNAYDRDGDALQSAILYSPNGGKRWVPVAWGVAGNEYTVDMDRLPGGQRGQFKVVTTDGFNTTTTVSTSMLSVADKPPTASILQPAAAADEQLPSDVPLPPVAHVPAGWVTFEAHGSDLEDGALRDRSFLWFVGDQGASLGRGRRLAVQLDGGAHLVTLVVVDSAGNTAAQAMLVLADQQPSDAS